MKLALIISLSLLLAACGSSRNYWAGVATGVGQTVKEKP
jgi:hypothetical protein